VKNDDQNPDDQRMAGTPSLDLERYRPMIAAQFITQEEGDAFLRALFRTMLIFVDFGMDVKSSTEKLPFMIELSSEFGAAAPESEDTEKTNDESGNEDEPQKDDS